MGKFALLAGAALLVTACAREPELPFTVSDVTVEADLTSVGTREATSYWQRLPQDLETAIAGEFVGRIDPKGNTIVVDIDEISLNSPFAASATAQTAVLSGRVEMLNPAGTSEGAYNVTASAQDIQDFLPAGENSVSIPPTSSEYYRAIVQAFARGVKQTLDGSAASS
jgi:hypothetical protein